MTISDVGSTESPVMQKRLSASFVYRIVGFVIIFVCASVFVPRFLTAQNILNLIRQVFLLTLVSYGVALSLLVKGLDLSVGSVAALSSCLAATLISNGQVTLGIGVGLAMGALCGLANGFLITGLGVPDFITTFSMMYVARGLAYTYTGGGATYRFPSSFLWLGKGYIGLFPVVIVVSLALMLVIHLLLRKTVFGKEIYATGMNKVAAVYSGISVRRVVTAVYVLSGLLAGFAGLTYVARMNAAAADLGGMWSLQAVAACVIGGITFEGGEGSILGLILGASVIEIISNCVNLLGIPSRMQDFVLGFMIITVVALDYYIKRNVKR